MFPEPNYRGKHSLPLGATFKEEIIRLCASSCHHGRVIRMSPSCLLEATLGTKFCITQRHLEGYLQSAKLIKENTLIS